MGVAGDLDVLVSGDDTGAGMRAPLELLLEYGFMYICMAGLLSNEFAYVEGDCTSDDRKLLVAL